MRIDRTHKPWLVTTLALLALSVAAYILFAVRSPSGPQGGNAAGLTFGIIGYALTLYASLLGARKQKPIWRIGRTQTWMRGHLWLGTLSLILILFHGGFTFPGPLTALLMTLFFIVIITGWQRGPVPQCSPGILT